MIKKLKKMFVSAMKWAEHHWLAIVIFTLIGMLTFVSLIAFSWLYGYWSNALAGTKFEIASCWQGISVVITGLAGVAALAGAGWAKYHTDSKFNSVKGEKPRFTSEDKSGAE